MENQKKRLIKLPDIRLAAQQHIEALERRGI
jgi:hypothetical protein